MPPSAWMQRRSSPVRNYVYLCGALALLCRNEYFTLALLLLGLAVFLFKLFAAASERSW